MGHLKDSIHINAPADKVWEFGDDPHNWSKFMTGMSGPDRIVGDGGAGTEYELTVLMAGVHVHVTSRLAEDRRQPDGSAHSRFEMIGAAPGWMTWDLEPEKNGTLVTVEEEYTVPGSVLGRVADRLVIERMEARDMRHSLENLKLLVEASGSSAPLRWDEHE